MSAAGHTGSSSLGPRAIGRLLTSSRASGGPRGTTRGAKTRAAGESAASPVAQVLFHSLASAAPTALGSLRQRRPQAPRPPARMPSATFPEAARRLCPLARLSPPSLAAAAENRGRKYTQIFFIFSAKNPKGTSRRRRQRGRSSRPISFLHTSSNAIISCPLLRLISTKRIAHNKGTDPFAFPKNHEKHKVARRHSTLCVAYGGKESRRAIWRRESKLGAA